MGGGSPPREGLRGVVWSRTWARRWRGGWGVPSWDGDGDEDGDGDGDGDEDWDDGCGVGDGDRDGDVSLLCSWPSAWQGGQQAVGSVQDWGHGLSSQLTSPSWQVQRVQGRPSGLKLCPFTTFLPS